MPGLKKKNKRKNDNDYLHRQTKGQFQHVLRVKVVVKIYNSVQQKVLRKAGIQQQTCAVQPSPAGHSRNNNEKVEIPDTTNPENSIKDNHQFRCQHRPLSQYRTIHNLAMRNRVKHQMRSRGNKKSRSALYGQPNQL